MKSLRVIAVALLLCAMSACALKARSTLVEGSPVPQMSELWAEADPARDLFWGPGGHDAAPNPQVEYRVLDTMSREYAFHVVETGAQIEDVCDDIKNRLEPLFIAGVGA